MVRLKDIADACGVSVATVSRTLNGVTNTSTGETALWPVGAPQYLGGQMVWKHVGVSTGESSWSLQRAQ